MNVSRGGIVRPIEDPIFNVTQILEYNRSFAHRLTSSYIPLMLNQVLSNRNIALPTKDFTMSLVQSLADYHWQINLIPSYGNQDCIVCAAAAYIGIPMLDKPVISHRCCRRPLNLRGQSSIEIVI